MLGRCPTSCTISPVTSFSLALSTQCYQDTEKVPKLIWPNAPFLGKFLFSIYFYYPPPMPQSLLVKRESRHVEDRIQASSSKAHMHSSDLSFYKHRQVLYFSFNCIYTRYWISKLCLMHTKEIYHFYMNKQKVPPDCNAIPGSFQSPLGGTVVFLENFFYL